MPEGMTERELVGFSSQPKFAGMEPATARRLAIEEALEGRKTGAAAKQQLELRQREEGKQAAIRVKDEYGDEIKVGDKVYDDFGQAGKVRSINLEKETMSVRYDRKVGKHARTATSRGKTGKIAEFTRRRQGKEDPLAGIGRTPQRMFGESEEAFGTRMTDFKLYSNPLVRMSEVYTQMAGSALEKAGALFWRMVPDAVQMMIRERPSMIRQYVPGGEKYLEKRGEVRGFIAEHTEKGFELAEKMTRPKQPRFARLRGKRIPKFTEKEELAEGRLLRGEATPEDLLKIRNDAAFNDAIEAVKEARVEFDNLGGMAVTEGLMTERTFFKREGKYMPRFYRNRGIDYDALLEKYGEKMPNRRDLTRFMQREDLPEYVRVMLGEIKEPGMPTAKGVTQLAHDIGTTRLFNYVAENPAWANKSLDNLWRPDAKPTDYVLMPSDKKLGSLRGMYVDKWIADDLNQVIRKRSELEKLAGGLVSEWKVFKVIFSPATWGRNAISNVLLNHLQGLPMGRVDIYYKGAREFAKGGELYQEAKAASQGKLSRGTFTQGELDNFVDAWNNSSGSLPERLAAMREALTKGRWSEALRQVRPSSTKAGQAATRGYQALEQWAKLSKYIHNKEKGMAPKEAWVDAEKSIFDYSEVPKFIDWSRKSPIGAPFITFTYKALPLVAESIIVAPWRMAAVLGTLYGINKAAYWNLGMSEEEIKRLEENLPEHMRGTFLGARKYLVLPFRDKYGQILYLDLTYILPWGDVGERGGVWRHLPITGSPLVQTMTEIATNHSAFTGKEIYEPWESQQNKNMAIALHIWRQVAPSLAPGGYGYTRLEKAITQKPDYRGRTSSLPTAAASTLLGLKTTPIDPGQERRYREYEKRNTIRDIEMEIGKVKRNRGMSLAEKAKEIHRLKRLQFAVQNPKEQ